MSFLDRFRKKPEDEASRIARLSKTGRMTDGRIIDAVTENDGRITEVTYTYMLAGVLYESSQALDLSQQALHRALEACNAFVQGHRKMSVAGCRGYFDAVRPIAYTQCWLVQSDGKRRARSVARHTSSCTTATARG